MVAGHVGIAIGALGLRRAVPLWLLIFASQLPDWADAVSCLAGVTASQPGMFSHSLPAVFGLSVAAAVLALFVPHPQREQVDEKHRNRKGRLGDAMIVGLVVLTHYAGDLVTGLKPTWPGGPMIGMQLYVSPALDFLFEASIIAGGWMYYRRTFPEDRRSSRDVIAVLVVLLGIQLAADILFSIKPGIPKC